MEDVKVSNGADCQLEQKCDEKERFDKFMNVMVQIFFKFFEQSKGHPVSIAGIFGRCVVIA